MKMFRKPIACFLVAVFLIGSVPRPAQATCTTSAIWQIVETVINVIGFVLWQQAIQEEIGSKTESAVGDYSSRNVAAIEELSGVIQQQNIFSQIDNDDFEINDHLEFFSHTSGEALKMAYLHYIAATAGLPGSQEAGQMLSQPLYGTPMYQFNKKLLNSSFNLRRADLASQVYFAEFNHPLGVAPIPVEEPVEEELAPEEIEEPAQDEGQALRKLQQQLDKVISMIENDNIDAIAIEKLTDQEKILALSTAVEMENK